MSDIVISTLACPHCKNIAKIQITDDEYAALENGAYVQDALSRFPADVRERFITGFCGPCWDEMFVGAE